MGKKAVTRTTTRQALRKRLSGVPAKEVDRAWRKADQEIGGLVEKGYDLAAAKKNPDGSVDLVIIEIERKKRRR